MSETEALPAEVTASADERGAPERIEAAATRLFAALGYDGASTRMIAEAAGVTVATLTEQTGGKRDLYLSVMERAHRDERAALDAAIAEMRAGASALALVDHYLDHCLSHPEVTALWMHRWLSDAADIADLEQRYVAPLIRQVVDAAAVSVGPEQAARIDAEYLVWTVVWAVHGFVQGGVPDADGDRNRPPDAEQVRRVRDTLHRIVGAQIGRIGAGAGAPAA